MSKPNDNATPSETTTPADEQASSSEPKSATKPADDLPHFEVLTPEHVEEDAIRGDFALRWVVILLAVLLGCTEIYETRSLVHIKSGQVIASSGGWAPATDPFSYTAADRGWANVSWFFDLVMAGLYGIGGWTLLSLFKAILAAVIFYLLVHISRPDLPTWWGSIIAALVLLATYHQITIQPELMTLLGLALTMYFLHKWRDYDKEKALWMLPILFLVWSNTDPRMVTGLLFLLLYAGGESIGNLMGKPTLESAGQRKQLWMVVGACFAAALVNRFGFHSLTSLSVYREYPILQSYYANSPGSINSGFFSILSNNYTSQIGPEAIAGLLVWLAAVVTIVLNRKSLDLGEVFALLGFSMLPLLAGRELAVTAMVAGVIATLNAQQWYKSKFSMTYSVETWPLLFTRGGRAITVLLFFSLAYFSTSGRLNGPNGRRTSVGIENDLGIRAQAYIDELANTPDDRPFNLTLKQGDLLIWADQKVFIDSRVALFTGKGDGNLIELHDKTRRAIRRKRATQPGSGDSTLWKGVFDHYEVSHVIPRIDGPKPDYLTYLDLLYSTANFKLTHLKTVAVFARTDVTDEKVVEYRDENNVDFVGLAFRDGAEAPPEQRYEWARPRSFYSKYLNLPASVRSRPVIEAKHYISTVIEARSSNLPMSLEPMVALCYLTIRRANEGLEETPNSADAFQMLGLSYHYLNRLETAVAAEAGVPYLNKVRYLQTLAALTQAVTLEPTNGYTHLALAEVYRGVGRKDLELRALEGYYDLAPKRGLSDNDALRLRQIEQLIERLKAGRDTVNARIEKEYKEGKSNKPPLELAGELAQEGFVLKALQILDSEPDAVAKSLETQLYQSGLLMEAGRFEEAYQILLQMEEAGKKNNSTHYLVSLAAANLGLANYTRATQLWRQEVGTTEQQVYRMLMGAPPQVSWPNSRARDFEFQLLNSRVVPIQNAERIFYVALTHLEAGLLEDAQAAFQEVLEIEPRTPFRPIVDMYLLLLQDPDKVDPPVNPAQPREPLVAPKPQL